MHPLITSRRGFLRRLLQVAAWAGVAGAWRPLWAAVWNQAAFEAMKVDLAIKAAGITDAQPSQDIVLNAPEIAENGAQVPIDVTSRIPGTERIFIFADRNVQPYVADFAVSPRVEPFVATRIKMGETSPLRVFVLAAGRYYTASREVQVTIGGCAS